MATKAITVRLDEEIIETLDKFADALAQRWRTHQDPEPLPGSQAFAEAHPTRSDMIRACITGYLMDHDQVITHALEELDS